MVGENENEKGGEKRDKGRTIQLEGEKRKEKTKG